MDWQTGGSYRNCKLASTMFTQLLQKRLGPDSGVVQTELGFKQLCTDLDPVINRTVGYLCYLEL